MTVDADAGQIVVVAVIDNLDEGHRRRSGAIDESCPWTTRDRRSFDSGSCPVSSDSTIDPHPTREVAGGNLVRTQGVSAPAGFRAAGITAGIKASGNADLALVFNEGPELAAAGVFTANKVKAAPVLWSQQVLSTGQAARGRAQFRWRQRLHGSAAGSRTRTRRPRNSLSALSNWGTETGAVEVAVCSTGLIGDRLPMDKVLPGVTEIVHETRRRNLGWHRRRARDHDHRHRAEGGRLAPCGQVERRRNGKGRRHAGAVAGDDAVRRDHRRRRDRGATRRRAAARPRG